MSLPPILDGMSEIRGALTADPGGQLKAARGQETAERDAAATAAAMAELTAAGTAMGLARLELVLVKGASKATVTAVRPGRAPPRGRRSREGHRAGREGAARGPPTERCGFRGASRRLRAAHAPAAPAGRRGRPTPPRPRAGRRAGDRRSLGRPAAALVRGQLTGRHAAPRARGRGGRAGPGRRRPVSAAELDAAMQTLLQGIGSVLAGDGVGGARTLEALATNAQRNLSFRWLASTGAGAPR